MVFLQHPQRPLAITNMVEEHASPAGSEEHLHTYKLSGSGSFLWKKLALLMILIAEININ